MKPARVIPMPDIKRCLTHERVQSPRGPILGPTPNVSTGPICWICGFNVSDPLNSANVHKFCASRKISTIRNAHHRWYDSSFALENSLIRVARTYMGPNWKGVLA